jgi:hypothetical protein
MKLFAIALLVGMLSLLGNGVVQAQDMEMCQHGPGIPGLHMCVQHAVAEGYIDNAGIAQSLFAKLDAAQAAVERGQSGVAANILGAFINEVQAQAGQHIEAEHAAHMVMHAQMVIQDLP